MKNSKEDYMCLTQIYNLFGKSTTKNIETWSRNSGTMSFIDAWERKNNPNFRAYGVEGIDLSLAKWIEQTGVIGLYTVRGKFGGTYAHKEIALNFMLYLNPLFQVLIYNKICSGDYDFDILELFSSCSIKNSENVETFVYLMKNTLNKRFKIGISSNLKFRERTLQSQEPDIETLIAILFSSRKDAANIERELHLKYALKRVRGEWFTLNETDVVEVINFLENYNI